MRASVSRGVVNPLHHAVKAKRVIYLYQAGGPSHLETFDYKPTGRDERTSMPKSLRPKPVHDEERIR